MMQLWAKKGQEKRDVCLVDFSDHQVILTPATAPTSGTHPP